MAAHKDNGGPDEREIRTPNSERRSKSKGIAQNPADCDGLIRDLPEGAPAFLPAGSCGITPADTNVGAPPDYRQLAHAPVGDGLISPPLPVTILVTLDSITFTSLGNTYRTGPVTVAAMRVGVEQRGPPRLAAPSLLTAGEADCFRYSLRRDPNGWVLVFQDGCAKLKHGIGVAYVAYLLSHPRQHIPSATLFSEFSTGHRKDTVPELPDPETDEFTPLTDAVDTDPSLIEKEEEQARKEHYGMLREYRRAMNDPETPEWEREDARQRHDELQLYLRRQHPRARSPGQAVTKLVYKSIQRFCHYLREVIPGEKAPNPVALAFAEYIERHILLPSRRYTRAKPGANVHIARGGLAGRLIFDRPPGHHWSVEPVKP